MHEAALCVTGIRQQRAPSQKGFELLNGLPFVAGDLAIHDELEHRLRADDDGLDRPGGHPPLPAAHWAPLE
jgi:hypothetical protein